MNEASEQTQHLSFGCSKLWQRVFAPAWLGHAVQKGPTGIVHQAGMQAS